MLLIKIKYVNDSSAKFEYFQGEERRGGLAIKKINLFYTKFTSLNAAFQTFINCWKSRFSPSTIERIAIHGGESGLRNIREYRIPRLSVSGDLSSKC